MSDYTEDYLAFYETYPRHEGKADGQKAWNGLSDGDKIAAKADVEKRKRMYAYSSNKKLIQLPASYLRAQRWEDDWITTLESSHKGDDLPNTGTPVYKPSVEIPNLTWQERTLNRLFRNYMVVSIAHGGLPDTIEAVKIKHEVLKEAEMLQDEEFKVQIKTIAELFMSRLDLAYGTNNMRKALKFKKEIGDGKTHANKGM